MIASENCTQKKLLSGINKCEELLTSCYGPRGTSVLMESFGRRYLTKYGSQILRELVFEDPIEDIARRCLADVSVRTESFCGDGTKTAVLLQCSLYKTMRRLIVGGVSEKQIYDKISIIKNEIIDEINKMKLDIDRSSLQDLIESKIEDRPLASLVKEAYFKSGRGTMISIGDSKGIDPYIELKEGYTTEDVMISREFFKSDVKCIKEGCLVAVTHLPLINIEDITPFLQFASKHPMLIVAPFIYGDAFNTLMMNKEKGVVDGICVSVSSEDIRNDIAAITKSTLLTRFDLKDDFDVELLGSCKEVIASSQESTILGKLGILTHDAHEENISRYLLKLKNEAETTESSFKRRDILRRISKISGGICQIKIGGFTELEKKDKRSKLEKVLSSIGLSIKTGVVPGGNTSILYAFLDLKEKYKNDELGIECLKAFISPIAKLCRISNSHVLDILDRNKENFSNWKGIDVSGVELEMRNFNAKPLICDPCGGMVYILNIALSSALELSKSSVYVSKKKGKNETRKR